MAMNNDHFHTHGPDELATIRAECDKWHKAYDRVWEERMRFADMAIALEKENAILKESQRWLKCSEKLPEDGEIVWAYNKSLKQIIQALHYGEVQDKSALYCTFISFNYGPKSEDDPVIEYYKIRKWEDTEWHDPTVDYMGIEEKEPDA